MTSSEKQVQIPENMSKLATKTWNQPLFLLIFFIYNEKKKEVMLCSRSKLFYT